MVISNKRSIEDEIRNSKTYQIIGDTGRSIVDGVVGTASKVVDDINREFVQPNNNPYNNSNYQNSYRNAQQNPPPPRQTQVPPQYRRQPPPPPPPPAYQNNNYQKSNHKAPVTSPKAKKPNKPKVQYKFNALRWILIISGFIVPWTSLPISNNSILLPIATAVCGVSGMYLFNWIFKIRPKLPKKEKVVKEKPKKEQKVHVTKSNTGNVELDKVIDEGNDYIAQLKKSNEAIPHEQLSESIERMEKASSDIFDYIKDKPEKIPQIKKFMNYYLPTTLKLLQNYEKLSKQTVKGENILNTMYEIECMMYTVATAFEKQLDALFSQEAMDIGVDITVFETILQQEGLKEEKEQQNK